MRVTHCPSLPRTKEGPGPGASPGQTRNCWQLSFQDARYPSPANTVGSAKFFYVLDIVNFQGRLCLKEIFYLKRKKFFWTPSPPCSILRAISFADLLLTPCTGHDSIAGQDTCAEPLSVSGMGLAMLPRNSHRGDSTQRFRLENCPRKCNANLKHKPEDRTSSPLIICLNNSLFLIHHD